MHRACVSNVGGRIVRACIVSYLTNDGSCTSRETLHSSCFYIILKSNLLQLFYISQSHPYKSNIVLAINSAFFPSHAKEYIWELIKSLTPLSRMHSSFLSLCLLLKALSLYFLSRILCKQMSDDDSQSAHFESHQQWTEVTILLGPQRSNFLNFRDDVC